MDEQTGRQTDRWIDSERQTETGDTQENKQTWIERERQTETGDRQENKQTNKK